MDLWHTESCGDFFANGQREEISPHAPVPWRPPPRTGGLAPVGHEIAGQLEIEPVMR